MERLLESRFMTHRPPPNAAPHQEPTLLDDEGEVALYKLQGMLISLAMDLKPCASGVRRDAAEALAYLKAKDPARARTVLRCLYMASDLVNVAADQLNEGIDWATIEGLYAPRDEHDFIDTPGHWYAQARAGAQNGHNGNGQNGHAPTGASPLAAELPTLTSFLEPPPAPTAELPPAPSKVALRRLGKSIRSDNEKEKRRFYAVARDSGLPTGEHARDAMFAALSQLFGETLTSHSQLDEIRWSKATSALHTRDLFWFAPPKRREPSRGGPKL
jgi:hypothetical protein